MKTRCSGRCSKGARWSLVVAGRQPSAAPTATALEVAMWQTEPRPLRRPRPGRQQRSRYSRAWSHRTRLPDPPPVIPMVVYPRAEASSRWLGSARRSPGTDGPTPADRRGRHLSLVFARERFQKLLDLGRGHSACAVHETLPLVLHGKRHKVQRQHPQGGPPAPSTCVGAAGPAPSLCQRGAPSSQDRSRRRAFPS